MTFAWQRQGLLDATPGGVGPYQTDYQRANDAWYQQWGSGAGTVPGLLPTTTPPQQQLSPRGGLLGAVGRPAGQDGNRSGPMRPSGGGSYSGYINMETNPWAQAANVASYVPGPVGWLGTAAATGMRANNVGYLDQQGRAAGLAGLNSGQMLGGVLPAWLGNGYGQGTWEANLAGSGAMQRAGTYTGYGTAKTSPSGPVSRNPGALGPASAVALAGSKMKSSAPMTKGGSIAVTGYGSGKITGKKADHAPSRGTDLGAGRYA